MWQTPESMTPAGKSTPAPSSFVFAASTSATRSAIVAGGSVLNSCPADAGSTNASVTLPVSYSTPVSLERGFRSRPSAPP
jgi:hypothetical protein